MRFEPEFRNDDNRATDGPEVVGDREKSPIVGEDIPTIECSTASTDFDSYLNEIEKKLDLGSILNYVDQAFLLYCEYAHLGGFSVRKGELCYIGKLMKYGGKSLNALGLDFQMV